MSWQRLNKTRMALPILSRRVLWSVQGPTELIERTELRQAILELFNGSPEIALLYFAGHGHTDDAGGFLCAGDSKSGHDGISLADIMTFATRSRAANKIIILDSCFSGSAADQPTAPGLANIGEGMTILAASESDQYAEEAPHGGAGVFTTLLVDALSGAAANLVGDITPGSVYAHIDQSLGPWKQRPVFKTNVKGFISLKKVHPPIPLADLKAITTHFPKAGHYFQLDPAFEPERSQDLRDNPDVPPPDPEKNRVFAVLQRYVKVNLVRPVGAPHMWHAAMGSKGCELTVLGEHYRKLVDSGMLGTPP